MKTFFIEARSRDIITIPDNLILKLPKKIGLVTTVQYAWQTDKIKKMLSIRGKQVFTSKKLAYEAQIIGCDASAALSIASKVDCFLYFGTGKFHPLEVAIETSKDVYIFNPEICTLSMLDKAEIEKAQKKKKAALAKFLLSENIGILVSTKPGQQHLEAAIILKKKLCKKGKYCMILLFDTLDYSELENFNFIDCFVNTACSRIAFDDYEKFPRLVVNFADINPDMFL